MRTPSLAQKCVPVPLTRTIGSPWTDTATAVQPVGHCELTSATASGKSGLDVKEFKALVKAFSESKLANFKELGMNGCPGVTDAGVAALAEACAGGALPALSLELRLGGATITEAGVTSLAKACEAGAFPKLKSLSLGNVSVSEFCKEALKSAIAKTKMNVDLFAPAPVS